MDQGCNGERATSLSPGLQNLIITRTARSDLICSVTLATALVMTLVLVGWRRPSAPTPAPPVLGPALVVIPPVTLPEPEERPPVQVRNPFDATEVFEFPPGTSETEARESTAQLLLKRARDRSGTPSVMGARGGDRSSGACCSDANRHWNTSRS